MNPPEIVPAQIAEISRLVAAYIVTQHEKYASEASPLMAQTKEALRLREFFSPESLNRARLRWLVGGVRIENPSFYPMLVELGLRDLPDLSAMDGITFDDVVVLHVPPTPSLLFHELVHVEQYRQLGVDRFSELYVSGFLNGGSYEAIPLEQQAYALEHAFTASPTRAFSVAENVARLHPRE